MPRFIAKLADNRYVEWSTVVDAPVSHVLTRGSMFNYLLALGQSHTDVADRLARTDAHGTSCRDPLSMEELVSHNRAGENETHMSVEQIIEHYNSRD